MSDLEVITKSRLESWNRCQRLESYTYRQGYRPARSSEQIAFGLIMHAGLEAWWLAHQRGELLALPEAVAAISNYRRDNPQLSIDDFAYALALLMMTAYDVRWTASMADFEVLGVEKQFVATIKGRKRLRVAGKLDVLVRKIADGSIWFVEHKTSGADLSAGSTYWQRLRMDPQVSIYHEGCLALGHVPAGCIYDVIEVPKLRQLKATPVESRKYTKATKTEPSRLYAKQRETDETVGEYSARVTDAVLVQPDLYFGRAEIVRLDAELEASRADVEETALQIRTGSLTGTAPRNPGACHLYGRTCPFLGVCDGTESLDDVTRFRKAENAHEELDLADLR